MNSSFLIGDGIPGMKFSRMLFLRMIFVLTCNYLFSLSLSLSLSHTHTYLRQFLRATVCSLSLSLSLSHTHTHTHALLNSLKFLMENMMGKLRIHVQKGVNLAIRDFRSSDPYVIIKMGKQKLKTRVVMNTVNPEWNDNLTLSISDPHLPVELFVYDRDTITSDDKMGNAEFEIGPFLEAVKMRLEGLPNDTILTSIQPRRQNYLAEESQIVWKDGKVVQNMVLRLRNVECGELELQLHWIDIPGSKGL